MHKKNKSGSLNRLGEIVDILRRHSAITGITPVKLRAIIEDLGPTFVKLGQLVSMRTDILPARYCEELQKLHSEVAPMPADEVRRVIEASLRIPLEDAFPRFEQSPLGSASIAQAHRASLPDGKEVVVKVQREGIYDKMASDITLLRKASGLLKLTPTGETVDLNMVLDEMWLASQQEMNFVNEAEHIEEYRRLNADVAYVSAPFVHKAFSTRHVLVMEEINGLRIDDRVALAAAGYEPDEITRKLCENYMKQILDDGFFHADPHPGNLLLRDGQIIWLDWGMAGRLSAKDQAAFRKAMHAAASKDIGGLTEAVLAISKHTQPIHRDVLYADVDSVVSAYFEMDIGSMNLSDLMQQILTLAQRHGLSMPPGVTLLARGIGTLEGLVADLSPDINLMQILTQRFANDLFADVDLKQMLLRDGQALYESVHKSFSSPALLNDALRAALKGELRLRVEPAASPMMEQAQNARATQLHRTILIAFALLASALMTLAPIEPKWFGIPWISAIGFICVGVALIGGWFSQRRRH